MPKLQMLFRGCIQQPKPTMIFCNAIDTKKYKDNKIAAEITKLNLSLDKHLKKCYNKKELEVSDRTYIRVLQSIIDYKALVRKMASAGRRDENLEMLMRLHTARSMMHMCIKQHRDNDETNAYEIMFVHNFDLKDNLSDAKLDRLVNKTIPYLAYKEAGREEEYINYSKNPDVDPLLDNKIPYWLPDTIVSRLKHLLKDVQTGIDKYEVGEIVNDDEDMIFSDSVYDNECLSKHNTHLPVDEAKIVEYYPVFKVFELAAPEDLIRCVHIMNNEIRSKEK